MKSTAERRPSSLRRATDRTEDIAERRIGRGFSPRATVVLARRIGAMRASPLVLSGGMQRSGSTLLFNMIRCSMETKYGERLGSGTERTFVTAGRSEAYLIKVHTAGFVLRARSSAILCSYRDLRESLVSAAAFFGEEPTMELCRILIEQHESLARHADALFRYEDLVNHPDRVVAQIGQTLQFDVNVNEVVSRLPKDPPEASSSESFDPTTLLHPGHRTGREGVGWRQILPADLQAEINREYSWWFRKHGYDPY